MKIIFILKVMLIFIFLIRPGYAQQNVIIKAKEIRYSYNPPVLVGEGKVKVEYQGITVEAEKIQINLDSSEIKGWGNISLSLNSHRIRGKKLSFNLKRKEGFIEQSSGKEGPIIFRALKTHIFTDRILLSNGSFTTCDRSFPHYRIVAKNIQFYPGEKIVVRNATFYLDSFPVFWAPVFVWYLTKKNRMIFPQPGYNEFTGWYLKTGYYFYPSPYIEATAHFDYYQKKSLAGGIDLSYLSKQNEGDLTTYYIREKDTGETRGMARVKHITSFSPNSLLKLRIDYLSDEDVINDYFYNLSGAEKEISPSFLSFNFTGKTRSFRIMWQPKINGLGNYPQLMPKLNVSFFQPFLGKFYLREQTELTNFIQEGKNIMRGFSSLNLSSSLNLFNFIKFKPTLGWRIFSYQLENQDFISKSLNNQSFEFFLPLSGEKENLTSRLSSTIGYYRSTGLGPDFPFLDYREKEAVDKNLIRLRLQNDIFWKKSPVFSSRLKISYDFSSLSKKLNPVEVRMDVPFSGGKLYTDFSYDVYDKTFPYFRSGISINKKGWNVEVNYSNYLLDERKLLSGRVFLNLGENISFYGKISYDLNLKKTEELSYSFDVKLDCLGMKIDIREKPQLEYNFGLYILAFSLS